MCVGVGWGVGFNPGRAGLAPSGHVSVWVGVWGVVLEGGVLISGCLHRWAMLVTLIQLVQLTSCQLTGGRGRGQLMCRGRRWPLLCTLPAQCLRLWRTLRPELEVGGTRPATRLPQLEVLNLVAWLPGCLAAHFKLGECACQVGSTHLRESNCQ